MNFDIEIEYSGLGKVNLLAKGDFKNVMGICERLMSFGDLDYILIEKRKEE